MRCNLRCVGCYAAEYDFEDEYSYDEEDYEDQYADDEIAEYGEYEYDVNDSSYDAAEQWADDEEGSYCDSEMSDEEWRALERSSGKAG